MHTSTSENRAKVTSAILWSLVGVGVLLRLVNPFYSNPLEFLISDPLRHFLNAKDCLRTGPHPSIAYEVIDPLGYQIWLSAVLRVTGGDRTAIALYTGLLSVLTPWIWYRWMRLSLDNKQLALAGYAVLSLLPDWIKLYQFFLQETLLLPLVGLSLWLSWRVLKEPYWRRYMASGFTWGCALMTKLTALPMAAITLGWLFLKSRQDKRHRRMAVSAIVVAILIFSLGPWKIYSRTHSLVPFPPGDYHRIWYESGKENLRFTIKFLDSQQGYTEYVVDAGNPALDLQLRPLFDWRTSRTGTCDMVIDMTKGAAHYLPDTSMSVSDRLKYTGENIMYFFLGLSWPENHVSKDAQAGIFHSLIKSSRFLWFPITLAIIVMAAIQRRRDIMIVLFAGSLAFFLFQQSIIFEARYKKPWEGIAVATLLSLVGSARRRAKSNEPQPWL
jgi:4-amino-4-deoxy-L-arabinose transferase-like glycosyltransferase